MPEFAVVLCTVGSKEQADTIAKTLVNERWAACVNILPTVISHYHWKDKVCEDSELMLVIKTRSALIENLIERIRELHKYDVPEIIALPIVAGSRDYFQWLATEIKKHGN